MRRFLFLFVGVVCVFLPVVAEAATNGTTINNSFIFSPEEQGFNNTGTGFEFGQEVAGIGDLNNDGFFDLAIGAGLSEAPSDGTVYITFLNGDGDFLDAFELSSSTQGGLPALDNNDSFGYYSGIAPIDDLDGDGVTDLAVGAFSDDDVGANSGAIYILFMETDGSVASSSKIGASSTPLLGQIGSSDQFGTSIANIGDLDGDGITDIAVGAPKDDDGTTDTGAVYILFLNATGSVKDYAKLSALTAGFGGQLELSDFFGSSVATIGDLNNDGVTDIAVGAWGDDDGGNIAGSVYVFFLNTDGSIDGYQKITEGVGGFDEDLNPLAVFGNAMTAPGDLDGDDIPDLIVGADQQTDYGGIYYLFLNTDGTVKDWSLFSGDSLDEAESGANFGKGLSVVGDIDGNGISEIAVGEFENCHFTIGCGGFYGAVYILFLAESSITTSIDDLTLTEGAGDTVDVTLNSEPLSQVDVLLSMGADIETDVAGVCFTATSTDLGSGTYAPCTAWDEAQTVTITATDDSDVEGAHTDTLTLTASSSDDSYEGASTTVSVTITDNDSAGGDEEEDDNDNNPSGANSRDTALPHETEDTPDDDTPQTTAELIATIQAKLILLIQEVIRLLMEEVGRV